MTDWATVTEYHRQHGDDYGSEEARKLKYDAICSLLPWLPPGQKWQWGGEVKTILDVGCGDGQFKQALTRFRGYTYTGIDLLHRQNVLDYHERHDIVVANGVLYQLNSNADAEELLQHCWGLAKQALIFTSLRYPAPDGELGLIDSEVLSWVAGYTSKYALRADYLPTDFTVAMYR